MLARLMSLKPLRASRGSRIRSLMGVLALALLVLPVLSLAGVGLPNSARAEVPGNQYFQETWQRTDKPVLDQQINRTWMWGPEANTDVLDERYEESPNHTRKVQYYDKSRMEITDPNADPNTIWYVTNGLLVNELVSGRMQVGHNTFENRGAAQINVAGDPDDPDSPTYATFAGLRSLPPLPDGSTIIQRVDRDGTISDEQAVAGLGVTAAHRVQVAGIDHQVASPFWDFMNSSGKIYVDGYTEGPLFENPFYATGYPIAEPYWSTVRVQETPVYVLIQCFERRCLTYTPSNSEGWKVEAGNVGQHYYRWRYEQPQISQLVSAANGGTVRLADRVVLTIPPGALDQDATITITQLAEDADGSTDGLVAISRRYRITADGGESVELNSPATLEVAYNPNRIPSGRDVSDVLLAWKTSSSGGWQAEATEVRAPDNMAIAHPTHLSNWSVFVPIPENVTPTATTCGDSVDATLASDPSTVAIGQTFSYLLTLAANSCSSVPTNATVTIDLPDVLEYIETTDCSSAGGTSTITCAYDTDTGIWSASGTIAPGDTLTLRFDVRVPLNADAPPASIETCANVFDGTATANICATTTVSADSSAPSKVSEPATVAINEQYTYIITFSTGPNAGVPGGINDYLPDEVTFIAMRCFTQSGQSVGTCSYDADQHLAILAIDDLAAFDTLRMEIDVRYPPPLGSPVSEIHNCAQILDGSDEPKSACATTTVEQ
jgi:hypothetical protein